ncbi:kinase-like domain-containing protein [Xylaria cubensis]|nr:kinase-like domain-containing protein [Xylaria cubensis]
MSHSLALFSLVPTNDRAIEVLNNPRNKKFVRETKDGERLLDIGHIRTTSGNASTLATMGRDGDIILEGNSISKVQCSFEINQETNIIMFYDRSHSQTCQVYEYPGAETKPFEPGRPRKVVVGPQVNLCIGLGGAHRNLYEFRLKWKDNLQSTMNKVKKRECLALEENSRLAETVDESDTVLPSQMETRVHNTVPRQLSLRWVKMNALGGGAFGEVYKAVNVDNGTLLAVKRLKKAKAGTDLDWLKASWRREVKNLSMSKHPHIVECFASSGWDEGIVEIVMALKDGSLKSLMLSKKKRLMDTDDIIKLACHHILQALDYLTLRKIVHRDVKPDNILYSEKEGRYHFVLGDFGLSNSQFTAVSACGSGCFMAPELHQSGPQTDKADIWSLFVTLLWTSGNEAFHRLGSTPQSTEDLYKSISEIGTSENRLINMREMGTLNPKERASAAQMLVKCYGGEGLTTPRRQVPPLFQPLDMIRQAPVAASQVALPMAYPAYHDMVYQGLAPSPPDMVYGDLPIGHQAPPMACQAFPIGNQVMAMGYETLPMGDQVIPVGEQVIQMGDQVYYDSPAAYQIPGRVHEDQAPIRRDTDIAHDVQIMPHPTAPPQLGPRRATHPFP